VIRTVLYLDPKDGDHGAVVGYYRRSRILERAAEVDGFLSSELQVPARGEGAVLVTALWRDAAAYDRWVEHPARAGAADELAELLAGDFGAAVRGELYEVVLAQEPVGDPGGGRG
jgi:heme-degrading monooxygenase HmoA